MSASLIMTLLFILWGNLDFVQISGCFVMNMCMCWFGDIHELLNMGKPVKEVDWTSFWYGSFCGMVPWLIMFFEIGRAVREVGVDVVPWWVWAFVAEYFLLFFTFPYTMFAQYMQWGKYNNDNYPLLKNGGYL